MRTILSILLTLIAQATWAQITPSNGVGNVTLAWDHSVGTNVAGYYIYWGNKTRWYTNRMRFDYVTEGTVTNVTIGVPIYFTATAYSTENYESDFSNEVTNTLAKAVPPPANLKVNR